MMGRGGKGKKKSPRRKMGHKKPRVSQGELEQLKNI